MGAFSLGTNRVALYFLVFAKSTLSRFGLKMHLVFFAEETDVIGDRPTVRAELVSFGAPKFMFSVMICLFACNLLASVWIDNLSGRINWNTFKCFATVLNRTQQKTLR